MGLKPYSHIFLIFSLIIVHYAYSISVSPVGQMGRLREDKRLSHAWSMNLEEELALRKKLCPDIPQSLGYQYRYHNETSACHKIGSKGPCTGDNMAFFAYPTNAVYGTCDCNYNENPRPLIYDETGNTCHFVYSRAYCKQGEWLTFDPKTNWTPICKRNKCLNYYEHLNNLNLPNHDNGTLLKAVSVEFLPYYKSGEGHPTCVPLTLSCDPDKDEEPKEWGPSMSHLPHQIQFVKGKVNPRCVPVVQGTNNGNNGERVKPVTWKYPTPRIQCVPGSYWYKRDGGKCQHSYQM